MKRNQVKGQRYPSPNDKDANRGRKESEHIVEFEVKVAGRQPVI